MKYARFPVAVAVIMNTILSTVELKLTNDHHSLDLSTHDADESKFSNKSKRVKVVRGYLPLMSHHAAISTINLWHSENRLFPMLMWMSERNKRRD